MPLILILSMLGWTPTAQASEISQMTVDYSTTTAPLILQAIATKHGVKDPQSFVDTAKCESQYYPTAFNKKDPNGGSRGVFQFQAGTFARYSAEAGLPDADVWDPWDNAEVAAYMFSKGQQNQWSCYRKLFK